jgi:hypothetical protein
VVSSSPVAITSECIVIHRCRASRTECSS